MRVAILTTGGTIEKTYNESNGTLANVGSVLHHILRSLRHYDMEIRHIPVMSKDSLVTFLLYQVDWRQHLKTFLKALVTFQLPSMPCRISS